MNLYTAGNALKHAVFPNIGKINVLLSGKTKHMLLFIFHALYMCLTVEDLHRTKKNNNGSNVSTIYRSISIIDMYAIYF